MVEFQEILGETRISLKITFRWQWKPILILRGGIYRGREERLPTCMSSYNSSTNTMVIGFISNFIYGQLYFCTVMSINTLLTRHLIKTKTGCLKGRRHDLSSIFFKIFLSFLFMHKEVYLGILND